MKTVLLSNMEIFEIKTLLQSRIEEELRSNEECKKAISESKDESLKQVFRILIECNEEEITTCNSILNKISF